MAYVTNSARGHFDYPNYKPYEINVLKRIQKQGWYYGKIGAFKWQAFIFPALFIHQWIVVWRWIVYRRNELYVIYYYILSYIIIYYSNIIYIFQY